MRGVSVVLAVAAMACSGGGGGGTGGGTGGSGGSGGSGGAGGGTGGPITISGRVFDFDEQAVGGATVVILGKPSVTTNAMGVFSIADVTPPYDIATVVSGASSTYITIFMRATRRDPKLFTYASTGQEKMATVTGTLSGSGVFPAPAGRETFVAFESPSANPYTAGSSGMYSLSVYWRGPTTITGSVHAMQLIKDASGAPSDYVGYGKLDNVLIATGNTAMMNNVALTPVTEQQLAGMVTLPANFSIARKYLSMQLGTLDVLLGSVAGAAPAVGFTTPNLAGATFEVSATATGSGSANGRYLSARKRGLAGNATNVNLTMPVAPGLSLPVEAATGLALATQPFSWSAVEPAGLYSVNLRIGDRYFSVFTDATSFTLPSTTELGLGTLPSGSMGRWDVTGFVSGVVTVDALLGASSILSAFDAPNGDSAYGSSESRTFTTQ